MSMKTLAIASLAVRSAVRSRLVVCLLIGLFLAVLGIPATVKGDGTLAGLVRVRIRYSLGAVVVLLGAATVWGSCLSIADEVEEKQIQMVVVKPVHRFQIWLGKWVGLLFLNAVLLSMAGAVTYALLLWDIRSSRVGGKERRRVTEEVLVGRTCQFPRSESVDAVARRELERLIGSGQIPADIPYEVAIAHVARNIRAARSTVAPGQSKTWTFDLPRPIQSREGRADPALSIQFHLAMYTKDRQPVTGTWTVGTPGNPAFFSYAIRRHLHGTRRFHVPVPPQAAGATQLVVTFTNGSRDVSHAALFRIDRNIELFVRETSFEINLMRALLIAFSYLGVLAALGLSASAWLSFPVASFSAVSSVVIVLLIHYFHFALTPEGAARHRHGPPRGPATVEVIYEKGIKTLGFVVEPAIQFEALGPLSNGVLIPRRAVAGALVLLLGVYSGILALAGGWILVRREMALLG